MATIDTIDSSLTQRIDGGKRGVEIHSAAALLADTVEIDETAPGWPLAIRGWRNVFLSVQMFDTDGTTLMVDTAGSFAISILSRNCRQYESPPQPTISALLPVTTDYTASTYGFKVVPTSLSDITTYRVVATFLLL